VAHDALPSTATVPSPPRLPLQVLRPVAASLLRRRYDVQIHGAEHVPTTGAVILTCNHIGLYDGPLLTSSAPRLVHALVKQEMFEGAGGPIFRGLGQIEVERAGVDPRAVKQAVRVLRGGGVVAIYPEGTRGRGDVAHSRLGAAYLALVTGAVVVPVAHLGTRLDGQSVHAVPQRGQRLDLVFGAPLRAGTSPVQWPRRSDVVQALAEDLRRGLARHVEDAVALTGRQLPDLPPDIAEDAPGRAGHEVGPQAEEQAS
jgi:1-acyl-sn-glycerol-3-phosphate acyltransferase